MAGDGSAGPPAGAARTRSFEPLGRMTLASVETAAAQDPPTEGMLRILLRRPRRSVRRLSRGPAMDVGPGPAPRAVDPAGADEVLDLTLRAKAAERLCPGFGAVDLDELALRQPDSALVDALLDSLWAEGDAPDDTAFVEARLSVLLHELARLARTVPSQARPAGGLAPWALNRVVAHLEASLSETVSLAEVAALARLSPYHFSRAFKVSTGLPPHRWVQVRRVERAKVLLADLDMSVLAVAAAVGYDNPGHFARIFRREAGMTPREYRRSI
jgi:AraC-like DNA-binding protein